MIVIKIVFAITVRLGQELHGCVDIAVRVESIDALVEPL